eukprot:gene5682-5920_t
MARVSSKVSLLLLLAAAALVCILAMPAAASSEAQAAVPGRQLLDDKKKGSHYYYYGCYWKGKCYGYVQHSKKDDGYAKKECWEKYCKKYKYTCDAKFNGMEKPKC